jgi:predicted TIM-barrel fold metal-dependent hydrolase
LNPTIHIDTLTQLFRKYNVEKAIVFPNPNAGDKYPQMNNYKAECARKLPHLLIGFGRVDPRREDAIGELERIRNTLRLKGLKLHPFVECFRPDHPFFKKFFKKVNELKLPILFHTGDGFSSPGLITGIAKKYHELPIVFGHLREGSITAMKQCPNVYVETSASLPDLIELAVDTDEDRILFGSDIPYLRYPAQIALVEAARISERAKRKVLHDNFQRLFKER